MRIIVVVNCHVSARRGEPHGFDHPTALDAFAAEATLPATILSLVRAERPSGLDLACLVFALAVDGSSDHDAAIRAAVDASIEAAAGGLGLPVEVLTAGDVEALAAKASPEERRFFSVSGYPEIRNLGLIEALRRGADAIVQIDDDELVPPRYFMRLDRLLRDHPDRQLFTAPYEKHGTIRITNRDDLASWPKFSSMDADMARLEKAGEPVETLFGFGGNMIIRRDFARRVFYPLGVPRGEDFSLLLAARLALAHGHGGLAAWFVNDPDLTIDHRPPAEAKKDFLGYLEKNLRRFILEWLELRSQDAFRPSELAALSRYQAAMLDIDDYGAKLREIYAELRGQAARGERGALLVSEVEASEARSLAFLREAQGRPPRFPEYLRQREVWERMNGQA